MKFLNIKKSLSKSEKYAIKIEHALSLVALGIGTIFLVIVFGIALL